MLNEHNEMNTLIANIVVATAITAMCVYLGLVDEEELGC